MSKLIDNLHKYYRKDKYITGLMDSGDIELEKIKTKIKNLRKEHFFDTMSLEGVGVYERQLNFETTGALEDKRQQVEARWKTTGKCDLELLKAIALSWNDGEVEISFVDGNIEIKFASTIGVPSDIEGLKKAIEEAKPAHLGINYTFKYRTFGMVKALGQTTQYWKDKGYTYTQMREQEVL